MYVLLLSRIPIISSKVILVQALGYNKFEAVVKRGTKLIRIDSRRS